MAESRIINLPYNSTPLASDIFPVVSLDSGSTSQITLSGAIQAINALTLKAANYIYVTISSSASANGANLLKTYTTATTMTPCGSALSSSNRVSIILPPATYNFQTSALTLNTQYVDIVGLTKEASHVVLTSTNATATITQTANDVRCVGLTTKNTGAGYGWAPSSNLSLTYWENIIFGSINANNLSGTFNNCKSSNAIISQGGFVTQDGVASGTFINCSGSNTANYGGGFIGQAGVCTGTFTNCIGTNSGTKGGGFVGYLGGYLDTSSGTFSNCTGTNTGGGGGGFVGGGGSVGARSIAAGVYTNCIGTSTNCDNCGGFVGDLSIASGIFSNCTGMCYYGTGGSGFAGYQGIISGTFNNCTGIRIGYFVSGGGRGGGDFVSGGSITGRLVNCIAGTDWGGTISGQLINCSMSPTSYTEIPPGPGTYPSLSNSGNSTKPACYVNCLDGSGRLVNGSA